jgi:cobalt-zinc-cadmium efflux system protein
MAHTHKHQHDAAHQSLSGSIVLNLLITLAQIVGGIYSGSLSLLSDALHNLSDVLALALSWSARRMIQKQASLSHTFGYKRIELLAAFTNTLVLIIIAVFLIFESVHRFLSPEPVASFWVIVLSGLGIVFNGISTAMLYQHAADNLNIKSAYLHLFSDTLASVAVLLGGLLMYYLGWFWVDALLTLLIACYLIFTSIGLLKSTSKMLLLFSPEDISISKILEKVQPIIAPHKLYHMHLWPLNEHEIHFEARVDCAQNMTISEFNQLAAQIAKLLHDDFHIHHCTLQPDFQNPTDKSTVVQE